MKAKKGNDKAFIKLMDEEKVKLYKVAYIYMKNEDDALDVVQETVTKAYASIHTLKEEGESLMTEYPKAIGPNEYQIAFQLTSGRKLIQTTTTPKMAIEPSAIVTIPVK